MGIPCVCSVVPGGRSVPLPHLWPGDTLARRRREQGGGAPGHSCARSDQTVRLETKEETQGMAFYLGQFHFVRPTAFRLGHSLRYARSAVLAGRRAIEGKAVAARAADIASLCYFAWAGVLIEIGIGWHYTPLRENPSPQAPSKDR